MGIINRTFKFTVGGLTGAALGATAALLLAPESGRDLQQKLRDRIRDAKYAGAQAKEAKENELIRKYRLEVNDSGALKESEEQSRADRDLTIAGLKMESATAG
jgi:gas vesicle protein